MRKLSQLILSLSFFLLIQNNSKAQTTLVAGDIAFSGYVSSAVGTETFSFVLLRNITSGTVINFTDNAWLNTGVFRSGEQTVTWTANAALNAGSEITITGPSAGAGVATLAGGGPTGICTGTMPSLSTSGDQILAYQGTVVAPTFISAIHMNVYAVSNGDPVNTDAATWDNTNSNNTNASALPPGLTTGTNAIWIGTFNVSTSEEDNAKFTCGPDVSTIALARAALNNPANWATEDGGPTLVLPSGCNFVGIQSAAPAFTTHPSNSSICAGANTSFTIVATGATSFQWQVDIGAGFVNITNNATYSGATTATLNITAASVSMNGYIYRNVATNGSGSTNSNTATLTVTALPTNPTLLTKTPATSTVADGTPVSATFNAGSGGTGCTDDYRYTTNGGVSYLPYTPGSNISTTGLAAGNGTVTIEGRRASCSSSCQGSYVALVTWIVTPLPAGATTLNAGDIAFTGYAGTATPDEFSFVLLRNIGSGTAINFTDNGFQAGVLTSTEQTLTWTSNAAYAAGTEIKISGLVATLASGGTAGTVTGTALSLSTSGDQILAYRGIAASPTFISGIHMNVMSTTIGDPVSTTAAAWDGTNTGSTASALPTGLTTGVNAIWIGTQDVPASEFSNSRYGNCAGPGTLGPIATLRATLNNQANWISNNATPPGFALPTGCSYLGLGAIPNFTGQPSNASVCEGINASFTVVAGGATSYQWQVDNGGGFVNITNNATYSGATTATLNITATPLSFNGYLYRNIATNGSGSATSNSATLTVTALPVAPTLLSKTPAGLIVADGTPVSATFNPGSGGVGCTDDFRYTVDGGVTYLPYTPGSNISTTGVAAGAGYVFIEGRRASCSSGCQGTYRVLVLWRVSPLPATPTTLAAGDIAFSGYTSTSAADDFSFVLLKNIGAGTVINFTNNGWLSTNVFRAGEETVVWTAPAGGLYAGTEITISGLTATRSGGGAAGTVAGVPLNLSTSGDQILAYTGTVVAPTFISAIHMNVYSTTIGDPVSTTAAAWDGAGANTTNGSALPTGLTTGVNAIWIGTQDVPASEFNNSRYGNCAGPGVLGPLVTLRATLNNQANWISDDNTPPSFTLPTGCNYLLLLCPTITVTNPATTTGTAGTVFSQTFTSTGGVPTVTYSTSSTLPTGLTLSSAGVLSGTPTQVGTFPIVVIATDGNGCTGTGTTYSLVISCPAPITGTATPSSQSLCSGTPITTIVLSGAPAGATYNWVRTNTVLVTGIAASGSGDISGTLTSSSLIAEMVTFTITPTYYGTCMGTPFTATVTVNPAPTAIATPSSQTICSGSTITTIAITGTGTSYNWTRDNTGSVTGIASSGSGDISGSLTNTTNAPVTITFTITPVGTCSGTPITATVLVNPTPNAVATPSNQSICSGASITTIVNSGNVSGTTYNWTRDNIATVTGIAASGSGNISGSLTNTTASPVTVTFTITPTANSCPGAPITATVIVNPGVAAFILTGGGTFCQGTTTLTGPVDPNYTYVWERSLTGIATPNSFTTFGGTASTQAITVSGNYRLRVTNQFGCSASDTTPVSMADYVFNGSLATGDAQQTGRLNRFAVVSTCAAPKACPGIFTTTGARFYDSYTITNPRNVPVCATIGLTSNCGTSLFNVVYTGSFNSTSLCTNYLADPGSSFPGTGFMEATIPANGTIVVVVHEVNPGTGCTSYQLTVDLPRDLSPITATPPTVPCGGGTSLLTAAPFAGSYLWSPGGATTQSITTPTLFADTEFFATMGYGNNGCTRLDSITVLVSGNAPTITCPANISQNNTTGQCGSIVTYTTTPAGTPAPTVTYAFTGATTALGSGDGSGSFFNVGITNVTVTVTNTCGSSSCSFTVTITDNQPPTITTGSIASCYTTVAAAEAAALVATTATDNCPGVITESASTVGTCSAVITVTVTDANGNSATTTYNTRIDNTPPTVTTGSIGSCYPTAAAAEAAALAATTATDNCPGALIETASTVGTCSAVITVTTTDGCGNATAVTYNTRIDNTAPTVTVGTIASCYATVAAAEAAALAATSATDNCPGTLTETASTVGTCSAVITVTTTDACGNATAITYNTRIDNTPPVLTCPAPVTVSCASAVPVPNVSDVTGVSDNCTGPITVTHQGDVISGQTCANRYTITRTYRATDGCGNFAECTQIITVNDQTPPVLTCPAPVTVSCASAVPAADITSVTGVSDNCGGTVTVTHRGDVISGQTCANRYTITRTYRATDGCGNFAECTQIITVNDQTPPVLTCPAPVTVSCASAVPAADITSVTGVSDNCGGTVTVTHRGDVISGQTCSNRFTITRTYRATDVCGNFAECTQIITVNDQTPPTLTCPAPITVSCASAVPAPNIASVTGVSDNCGGTVTVTFVSDVVSNQTCANRFTITRTYRATDVCGNFAQCTQIITVNDQTPPVVTCPAAITVSCAGAVPAPNTTLVTATDNCAGAITITHISDVISNQTCPNRYTLTRTYRATDVCGNFAECTQIITVNDQTAPVITCPANITVTTPVGSCTAVVNYTVTATDNCNGPVTIVSSPASGFAFPIGTTTVTSTATDACGNSSTCTFTVTVLDAQLPVVTTQPVNRTVCTGGSATFNVTAITSPNAGGQINYQWQQWNGSAWINIAGATASSYTVSNATVSMNTNTFRVVLTGLCTVVNSNAATLFVNPLPSILLSATPPPSLLPNQTTTITATTNPSGGTFVWFFNNTVIPGVTGPQLGPIGVDGIGTYRAVYTDPLGCVNNSATINVTGQPSNQLWVYPNPNQGQFQVRYYNEVNEKLTLNIYNALGQKIYQKDFNTTTAYTRIDVNLGTNFSEGVYTVEVVNGAGVKVGARRVLVRHP